MRFPPVLRASGSGIFGNQIICFRQKLLQANDENIKKTVEVLNTGLNTYTNYIFWCSTLQTITVLKDQGKGLESFLDALGRFHRQHAFKGYYSDNLEIDLWGMVLEETGYEIRYQGFTDDPKVIEAKKRDAEARQKYRPVLDRWDFDDGK